MENKPATKKQTHKIAKWLGYKICKHLKMRCCLCEHDYHNDHNPRQSCEFGDVHFMDWLYSPEGQSAVMGKLKAQHEVIVFDGNTVSRCFGRKNNMYEVIATSDDLLLVVLEMLKEK